jgi:hypothetical protein
LNLSQRIFGRKTQPRDNFFLFQKAMSSDSTPPPPAAAAAEEHTESGASGEELEALQERISSLTSTFATSYAGLVGNLKHSVDMMQRINGIMEAYVVNALQMRVRYAGRAVDLRAAGRQSVSVRPSSMSRLSSPCCPRIRIPILPMLIVMLTSSPTPLARLRAPHERVWRAPRSRLRARKRIATRFNCRQPPHARMCCLQRAPAPCSLVAMARFASPASTHQLEARAIVPFPDRVSVGALDCRRVALRRQLDVAVPRSATFTIVDGERWRRLFADLANARPQRRARLVYRFSLHSDHTAM